MSKKINQKRKKSSMRVVPEMREQVDIEKLCYAFIEIAKSIAKEKNAKAESNT